MNKYWQDFLAANGARISEESVSDFGDIASERIATRDAAVLCDLSQFGVLRISGDDAQGFLQNLLSNDIRAVTPSRAQLSSLNSAKGRMLASFLVWRAGDSYFLQLPAVLCAPILKKLVMYVLRANVMVTDVSAETVTLGLAGTAANELLQTTYGDPPQTVHEVSTCEHGVLLKVGTSRWQIITSPQHATLVWNQFGRALRPVGSGCWDWMNIMDGVPVILPPTQEQFVAQMVNFDLLDGISFSKGCYPGQEIVARTRYLGKLKRRMYLAHVDCADAPVPGNELYSADMGGQSSGMIVNSAASPDGGYDVLAVVQIASAEAHPICIGSIEGAELSLLTLPYALT